MKSDLSSIVLPLSIFPPVNWFKLALKSDKVIVDPYENFVKQTFRNRYSVLGANNVLTLSIPVKGQKGEKIPTGEIEIDNKNNWQIIHWRSIVSAYRSSPFFEHYEPFLEEIFTRKYDTLLELYSESISVVYKLMQVSVPPPLSTAYVEPASVDYDLRPNFKKPHNFPEFSRVEDYMQVFSDRFKFIPDLSILDLLFNEGSLAGDILAS